MSIAVENAKKQLLWNQSYPADNTIDGSFRYCAVAFKGSVTGEATLTAPSANGYAVGILQNPDVNLMTPVVRGEVAILGESKARVYGAVNAGDLLCVADSQGRLTTASTGNWIIARAINSATQKDQVIPVELLGPSYR